MFAIKLIISSLLITSFGFCVEIGDEIPVYDSLKLVQKWGRGKCCVVSIDSSTKEATVNCETCNSKQKEEDWTIHGLWPYDSQRRTDPENCRNPVRYLNFTHFPTDVLKKMRMHWPNIDYPGNDQGLWLHQWKKHGTCARDIKGMDKPLQYFQKALSLYESYDLKDTLTQGMVMRDAENLKINVIDTIKSVTGKIPTITCDIRENKSYLNGIHICFDKQFSIRDCSSKGNCGTAVLYP